jgi:hypothetical protein
MYLRNGQLAGNDKLRRELGIFWDKIGGRRNYGREFSPEEKLELLLTYSYKKIYFKKQKSLYMRRKRFNEVKHHQQWFKYQCFVCGAPCDHRHHIIALINGGDNRKKNIISLCRGCHIAIHPWMQNSNLKQKEFKNDEL